MTKKIIFFLQITSLVILLSGCSSERKLKITYADAYAFQYDEESELNISVKIKNLAFDASIENESEEKIARVNFLIKVYKLNEMNDTVLFALHENEKEIEMSENEEEATVDFQLTLNGADSSNFLVLIKATDLISGNSDERKTRFRL